MDDRTDEQIDDAVERWHCGAGMGQSLGDFLGWTEIEYARWVETGKKP